MRNRIPGAAWALLSVLATAAAIGSAVPRNLAAETSDASGGGKKEKAAREPFYRKYLIAGAPLDDRILEQEKKVVANPDQAALRNDFGNLLAARRFPKEAREQYVTAMKLDKSNWMAPYNLGLLEETEGRVSAAISAYERSVDRNRGFPPSRFRLGRLYERNGRTRDAIAQYARAIQIDPEMREVRSNPLVADTHLLDRISVTIYESDAARASMKTEAVYVDEKFRRAPVDRSLWSNDFADPLEPEPVDAPRSTAPRVPASMPPRTGETRPQELGRGPAPPPPPAPNPVQPTPAPPDTDNPLGLRPRPLPTPLPQ